jgi:twitching motility protein PilT
MQLNSNEGMQTLDQSLAGLVRMKVVTPEEALTHSSHPDRLQKLIQFDSKNKAAI